MKTLTSIKKQFAFLSMFLLLFLFSCKEREDKVSKDLLVQAQSKMYTKPDSALLLLDSIKSPKKMSKDSYMQYIVALVQAKYKMYKDIKSDTLIFEAMKYFKENNDPKQAALAIFYSGTIHRERGLNPKTMEYYLEAERYAHESKDPQLNGFIQLCIGDMYYDGNLFDSSLVHYERALNYYNDAPKNDSLMVRLLSKLFMTSSITKQDRNSRIYHTRLLTMFNELNDKDFESRIDQDMGFDYRNIGDYNKASHHFLKALATTRKTQDSLRLYLGLSRTYVLADKLDSATYYTQLLKARKSEVIDQYTLRGVYRQIAKVEELLGNCQEALEYYVLAQEQYHKLTEADESLALTEIQKKYELSEKERQLSAMESQRSIFILVIIVIASFLIIAFLVIRGIRNKHKREKENNDLLRKQMSNMLYLNSIYKNIATESSAFENEIETLSITYGVKDSSKGYDHIRTSLRNMKKETEQRLSELTLDYLETQSVNKKILSLLNNADLLFLSLSYCGYETKDIAVIMGVKPHALQMRKSRLIKKLEDIDVYDSRISSFLQ